MRRFAVICLFVLASIGITFSQTVDLKVKGKVGDKYRYKMSASLGIANGRQTVSWTSTFVQKLTKVDHGLFFWETSFHTDSVKATGMPGEEDRMKKMNAAKITFIEDNRAQVVRAVVGTRMIRAYPTVNLPLPAGKIKIGGTWVTTLHAGTMAVPVTYKLVALRQLGKKKMATIQGTLAKGAPATATKPIIFMVDVSNGRITSCEEHIVFSAKGKNSKMDYTVSLFK